MPAARAEALGLARTAPRSLDVLRREAARAAELLGGDGEFEPARLAQLTAQAAAQLAPQPGAVVIHNDLKGEHLTVTPDGRVRGALDWSDAVIGDPAEDIAGLSIAVGARAAVRAATSPVTAPAPACAVCGWPAATRSYASVSASTARATAPCRCCAPSWSGRGRRSSSNS